VQVIDADSHFQEPLDWLHKTDPAIARRVPLFGELEAFLEFAVGDTLELLPAAARPKPLSLAPPTLRRWIEGRAASDASAMADIMAATGMSLPAAYCARDRIRWMDARGIRAQVILPTSAYISYRCARRAEPHSSLATSVLQAYNTWAAETVRGHTERLLPVMVLDLEDLAWCLREMARMRVAGSKVAMISAEPVLQRSLAHPDLDPFWEKAADLGITVMFHVGGGRAAMHPGWLNAGATPGPFLRLAALARRQLPELALGALIFGGILERHPELGVLVCELGIDWLPSFLEKIDAMAEDCEANEPLGGAYDLPLKPSEYIRRQVRVSVVRQHDRLYPTLARIPAGIVVFASDFPHPEGSQDAVEVYQRELGAVAPLVSESFFYRAAADILQIGSLHQTSAARLTADHA
jgi:uncharacterized protein